MLMYFNIQREGLGKLRLILAVVLAAGRSFDGSVNLKERGVGVRGRGAGGNGFTVGLENSHPQKLP